MQASGVFGCLLSPPLRPMTARADPKQNERARTIKTAASLTANTSQPRPPRCLDFRLLSELQRVIDFDAEVPHCAFEPRVTKQQLHRS